MAKAKSFFGGTKPKATGEPTHRAMGNQSATAGINAFKNNAHQLQTKGTDRRNLSVPNGAFVNETHVRQVGTATGSKGNNSQQVRDTKFSTKAVKGRPNLPGKEDNRTSWR